MSYRHIQLLHIFFAAIILLSTALLSGCGTKSGQPQELTDEQEELVRYYHTMKDVGLTGDVKAFNEMRDSLTRDKVMTYFRDGRRIVDSAKVSNWAYYWPDVAGLPIVQDSADGEWRRLLFMRDDLTDKDGREMAVYPMILFRKNNDTWKVSNASRLKSYKFDLEGNPRTVADFTYHELFRIPPDFSDIEKTPAREGERPAPPREVDTSGIVQPKKK